MYDLLLYIETYFSLVIGGGTPVQEELEEQLDFSKTNYRIEDLIHMRSQIHERFEGHELVKGFLKHPQLYGFLSEKSAVRSGKI